jgi:hypothetical protein
MDQLGLSDYTWRFWYIEQFSWNLIKRPKNMKGSAL